MNDTELHLAPLKLTLQDGDEYVDDQVPATRSKRSVRVAVLKPQAASVAVRSAFSSAPPSDIVVRYERVRLKWMRPDDKGGFEPR